MPLSEEEQRLLEQMEEALAAEDPKFASALQGAVSRARCKRIAIAGVAGFVVGVAVLLWGAIIPQTLVAVGGFLVMLAGSWFAATSIRRLVTGDLPDNVTSIKSHPRAHGPRSHGPRRGVQSGGLMNRMENRWRRRRDGST